MTLKVLEEPSIPAMVVGSIMAFLMALVILYPMVTMFFWPFFRDCLCKKSKEDKSQPVNEMAPKKLQNEMDKAEVKEEEEYDQETLHKLQEKSAKLTKKRERMTEKQLSSDLNKIQNDLKQESDDETKDTEDADADVEVNEDGNIEDID